MTDLSIPSIATPLDRAWQRYVIARNNVQAHPCDRNVLRRDLARDEWERLLTHRIRVSVWGDETGDAA